MTNTYRVSLAVIVDTAKQINSIRRAAGNPLHTCPTCGNTPANPYRRTVPGTIEVIEGCVDACHVEAPTHTLSHPFSRWILRDQAHAIRVSTLAKLNEKA